MSTSISVLSRGTSISVQERTTDVSLRPGNSIEVRSAISGPPGLRGEQGIQGEQGEPGESGLVEYEHTQSSAQLTWTVNHNLGVKPAVTLLTVGGKEYEAEVIHVTVNQFVVYHALATAGLARCFV